MSLLVIIVVSLALLVDPSSAQKKKNVLFLVSDDMRPELSVFSGPDFPSSVHPRMFTPHLDFLASHSLLLKRAYVQQAVCSPSRTSLLTGRRPDTTHVYDLKHYFREVGGNFTTIPQYFKERGYTSVGMGKIFHPGSASGGDDPVSWSEPYYHAPNLEYWSGRRASWEAVPPDARRLHELPDTQTALHAADVLQRLAPAAKAGNKPFFVAVGFHKPHLPFVFPEEFLQLYPEAEIRVPDNEYAPRDMPPVAWSDYGELRAYDDIAKLNASGRINTTLPDGVVRALRRAYYSALSYTDSLVGGLLRELERLGLWDDTIVSFWGDHGWQLGEHGEWCKHTNFELATHAPMMVRVPGVTDAGVVSEQLTEYVDLFPTLVEAAGFSPLPLCPEDSTKQALCREGRSLMPLMRPGQDEEPWKKRVFSQYPRPGGVMGYSMRTDAFRYTEWVKFEGAPLYRPDWSSLDGVELYDHTTDPDENVNAAHDPRYSRVRAELRGLLHQGWRQAT